MVLPIFNLIQCFKSCGDWISDGKASDKQSFPSLLSPLEGRYHCICLQTQELVCAGPTDESHRGGVTMEQWHSTPLG